MWIWTIHCGFCLIIKGNLNLDEMPDLSCLTAPPDGGITNWRQYYAWRGLPLDSLLAVLLQYPLTVYFIIQRYIAGMYTVYLK